MLQSAAESEAARKHGIPGGYSVKNWVPSEEPIVLLGSVFDANSLGKWLYDWTVAVHGAGSPISDTAGELWLLLIQLSGKISRDSSHQGQRRAHHGTNDAPRRPDVLRNGHHRRGPRSPEEVWDDLQSGLWIPGHSSIRDHHHVTACRFTDPGGSPAEPRVAITSAGIWTGPIVFLTSFFDAPVWVNLCRMRSMFVH